MEVRNENWDVRSGCEAGGTYLEPGLKQKLAGAASGRKIKTMLYGTRTFLRIF